MNVWCWGSISATQPEFCDYDIPTALTQSSPLPPPLPPPSALFCQIAPPLLLIIRQKTAVWRQRSNLPLTKLPKYKTQGLRDDDAKDDVARKYPPKLFMCRQNLNSYNAVDAIDAWWRWQGWEKGGVSREQGREGSSCRFTLSFCGFGFLDLDFLTYSFRRKLQLRRKKLLSRREKRCTRSRRWRGRRRGPSTGKRFSHKTFCQWWAWDHKILPKSMRKMSKKGSKQIRPPACCYC